MVTAVVAGPAAFAGAATEPASVMADHRLTSLDGKETTLSSFRGEVVVVNFWASWCAPCRKELPLMDEWNSAWADRGARVVAISIDSEGRRARQFAEQTNLSLTVLHDGPDGLAKSLDLPSLPCTFLLDRDGTVVSMISSSAPAELAALRRKVETLLAARQADGGAR